MKTLQAVDDFLTKPLQGLDFCQPFEDIVLFYANFFGLPYGYLLTSPLYIYFMVVGSTESLITAILFTILQFLIFRNQARMSY